jgi:ABC-type transporter lipoprotein component MlaA
MPNKHFLQFMANSFLENSVGLEHFRIGDYEEFNAASLEPYVVMREVYIQHRNKQIQK